MYRKIYSHANSIRVMMMMMMMQGHQNSLTGWMLKMFRCVQIFLYTHTRTCEENPYYICRTQTRTASSSTTKLFPPDWGMLRRSRCVQIFL